MMSTILHYIEGAAVFLVILSLLVAAHELGHYLFARLFNMGVEEFSIGMFGKKPLVTYLRRTYRIKLRPGEDPYLRQEAGGMNFESAPAPKDPVIFDTPTGKELEETTDFTIRPWPIGGFVRIKGMMPQEDGSETSVPGGFYSKPPLQRLVVLFAGPAFSVIAGVLVMIPIFMWVGVRKIDKTPVIGGIIADKAADKAGMKKNDRVLSINGKPVSTFFDIISPVRDSVGVPLTFVVQRGKETESFVIVPYRSSEPSPVLGPDLEDTGEVRRQGMIGLSVVSRLTPVGFAEATRSAIKMPIMAVTGLFAVVKEPSTARDTVGGPVTMFAATSDAVQQGFVSIAQIAAFISISVGVFNLLPIYPLDGGQMMVAFAELLRGGRRLSMRFQNTVAMLGFGMVLLIICGALFVDIGRFTSKPLPQPKIVGSPDTEKPKE